MLTASPLRLLHRWSRRLLFPGRSLRDTYRAFRELLEHDRKALELLSDLEQIHYTGEPADWSRISRLCLALRWSAANMVDALQAMHPARHAALDKRLQHISSTLTEQLDLHDPPPDPPYTLKLEQCGASPGLAGGKAASLGALASVTDIPQPRGFVITTGATSLFYKTNGLRHRIDELLASAYPHDTQRLAGLSAEIITMIMEAAVPPQVEDALRTRIAGYNGQRAPRSWAVRSSAVGEDGIFSFAGQYESVVAVEPAGLLNVYRRVLASKYAPAAISYRIRCGMSDQETTMAVLVMEMIDAEASGVIYTRDPADSPETAPMVVYAVSGPGATLVDGSATPWIYRFTAGGALPPYRDTSPAPDAPAPLTPETAELLACWGTELEQHFGTPQDIEWCCDANRCYLLQCRPLHVVPAPPFRADDSLRTVAAPPPSPPADDTVLLLGASAAPGVSAGTVVVCGDGRLPRDQLPDGTVLVVPTLSPQLSAVLPRLSAVVAETGSRASHFATVAREWGIPVIAGVTGATRHLEQGLEVTVDADSGRIHRGRHAISSPRRNRTTDDATPVGRRLARIIELVAPLHLTDPAAPDFTVEACVTIHDVIRYAHEHGMKEMFSLAGRSGRGMGRARPLDTGLPFTLSVIDLGGGLRPGRDARKALIMEDVVSLPLHACRDGLAHPDVIWRSGLAYLDWEEMDRVSGGIVSLSSAALGSYALISPDYLHLMLRFGYHFAIVDALAGPVADSNYLTFRFKGGGGDYANRLRRILLITAVLNWAGFDTHSHGDLLDARFNRRLAGDTLKRLTVVGFIQGKSQLLDMALDEHVPVQPLTDELIETLRPILAADHL